MVGIISDVGNYRLINEDSIGYFETDELKYYVVADGMGGHNAGEVASDIAIKETVKFIKYRKDTDDCKEVLINSIQEANKEIYLLSKEKEEYHGMGTTITACLIRRNKAFVANVGDSSCLVVKKDNTIKKITKDHSLVQELIDSGSITFEQALNHPNKNIITRALGTSKIVNIDIFEVDINDVTKIILCTDGLTNVVSLNEILNIVSKYNEEIACKALVELSKKKGSRDNISVIVFKGADENDR